MQFDRNKIIYLYTQKIFVFSFLLFGIVNSGRAQNKSSQLETLFSQLSARGQFHGSVLAAEHGTVLYKNGFGKSNNADGINFTTVTPTYLASLTKQFTAMAIMMLVERKQLAYTDSLSEYFPEFPLYARKITIRHLLNHTSGIPDYVGLGGEHPGLTNTGVLNVLLKQDTLQFSPGEKFQYSNSGYILLAMIVEKVSGQPFYVFLKKNIFGPLGMKKTLVYDESKPNIPSRARAYSMFGKDNDYTILTEGDGGIFTTVEDMFLWDQALYTEQLVKQTTLADAFKPGILNSGKETDYGFGWGLSEYHGKKLLSHAGAEAGFSTLIVRQPADRNTIILLTNYEDTRRKDIRDAVLNILEGSPYTLPKISIAKKMYEVVTALNIESAVHFYDSLKQAGDTTYSFAESELNLLGYEFLGEKKYKEAIEILKMNVTAYPNSGNVYDGLGEAYMKNGDKELAIKNYKRSLELDPSNNNAVAMLKKLGGK